MLEFDWVIFLLLCVAAAGLVWVGREEGVTPAASGSSTATVAAFWRHTKSYVVVYSLMMREWGAGAGACCPCRHARARSIDARRWACTDGLWAPHSVRGRCALGLQAAPRSCARLHACMRPHPHSPPSALASTHTHPYPTQWGTGCRVRMCTRSTSFTASQVRECARCALRLRAGSGVPRLPAPIHLLHPPLTHHMVQSKILAACSSRALGRP